MFKQVKKIKMLKTKKIEKIFFLKNMVIRFTNISNKYQQSANKYK
jgi:hypothetical protein